MTHWRQLTLWGLALKTWQGETFLSLFKECQISNFPSWDHVFAMKIKKTAWLLMAPVRGVRQRSQWCFLPLCPSDCCQLCFLSLLFFFTPQAEGLSTFHHWSNHMKTFLSFLPIIRSQLVAIFTPVQVFNPLSWNFDFWFDLWTGAAAASLTQPLLDSAQLTIRFLFWGNIITVCCHWIPILFFSAVVNSIWQVIGFVPATWW